MTPELLMKMNREGLVAWLLSVTDQANSLNWAAYKKQPPNYLLLELLAQDDAWSLTLPQLQSFATYVLGWIGDGQS